jgi:hypothetical protein
MTSVEEWVLDPESKRRYAGIYVLKMLDLVPSEGGLQIPVVIPSELYPLEEVMEDLTVRELIEIDRKSQNYRLTQKGVNHLRSLIAEAEEYIRRFDRDDIDDVGAAARAQGYDPLRVRFLWGWYHNEFDDLVNFQERRGVTPLEDDWAYYLLSDRFWAELAADVTGAEAQA